MRYYEITGKPKERGIQYDPVKKRLKFQKGARLTLRALRKIAFLRSQEKKRGYFDSAVKRMMYGGGSNEQR